MANKFNSEIERNTSHTITLKTNSDLTGWTFIYMAKLQVTDADLIAPINIQPTISTVNGMSTISIEFLPEDTKTLDIGYLYHSFRAINSDRTKVLVLFNGTLEITQDEIGAP